MCRSVQVRLFVHIMNSALLILQKQCVICWNVNLLTSWSLSGLCRYNYRYIGTMLPVIWKWDDSLSCCIVSSSYPWCKCMPYASASKSICEVKSSSSVIWITYIRNLSFSRFSLAFNNILLWCCSSKSTTSITTTPLPLPLEINIRLTEAVIESWSISIRKELSSTKTKIQYLILKYFHWCTYVYVYTVF